MHHSNKDSSNCDNKYHSNDYRHDRQVTLRDGNGQFRCNCQCRNNKLVFGFNRRFITCYRHELYYTKPNIYNNLLR